MVVLKRFVPFFTHLQTGDLLMPCKRRGVVFLILLLYYCGGLCGLVVNTSNCGSGGLGFKRPRCVVFLDKELYSSLSLFTHVYTAISRKVVGNSAQDNPERYCGWF